MSVASSIMVSSYYFHSYLYEVGYVEYSIGRAFVYISFAIVGCFLAVSEIRLNNNFNATLIGTLSFCMCLTAIFNLITISPAAYTALNEIKSGPGFSWRSIYSSIEILISIIVGGNGLNYLAHLDVCPNGKRNAIIRNNPNINTGEQ